MCSRLCHKHNRMANKVLSRLYYTPNESTAFAGARQLVNKAAKHGIPRKKVLSWLAKQEAYTLHKKVTRKFKTRPYVLLGMNDLWQADLADVSNLAKANDGVKFWLVVIDAFSKYLWVEKMLNKKSETVTTAFARILKRAGKSPTNLNTDKGGEFVNAQFQKYLSALNVNFYTAENPDTKACFAERVTRTIKERVYRYLTAHNTHRYADVLDDLVAAYNNSVHSAIRMKPIDVNEDTEDTVRKLLTIKQGAVKPKFKVGQSVRVAKEKKAFRKGYQTGWSEEIFKISASTQTNPVTYQLKDYAGETIRGRFYENELQQVRENKQFKIERVLRTRVRQGNRESLVKWFGYPLSMSSWVRTEDIRPTTQG